MSNQIDCLLIGPHQIDFSKQKKAIELSGVDNAYYRDLNFRFLNHNDISYQTSELLELCSKEAQKEAGIKDLVDINNILAPGIIYLGSYLNKNNLSFDYINSFKKEEEKLKQILLTKKVKTIALITTTNVTPLPLKEITSFIRKHNKEAKILIGGPFIWFLMRQNTEINIQTSFKFLKADIYVNSSEGEQTLVNIIKAINNNEPIKDVNNIIYKEGKEFVSTDLESENNLLEENMNNWDLFSNNVQKMVFARTSISCLFDCAFCDSLARLGKYRDMGVDFIEKELNAINNIGTVKNIRFIDDTFNIPKKRFRNILKMMIKNRYDFKWSSFIRCQYTDEETLELMIEAGCEAVHLGIESGSPQILENMNKKSTIEYYAKGLEVLNKHNIISYATFIVGFPGETDESVQQTINFINENKPTFSCLWPFFCSPLTPIWNEREKYGLTNWGYNWSHNTMDSKRALDIIEDILLSDKLYNSVFCSMLPEYITYVKHYGFSVDQLKNYLLEFNNGVKQKLLNQEVLNVDEFILEKMKNSLKFEINNF